MAAKPSDAKTTIDSLAELLKEKGKMELSKIAQNLGVEQNIIENWARVLEEGSLVKITYEVGKMYVEPATVTAEQERALSATVEAEKVKLENDLALQKSSLDKYAAKLETLGLSVKSAESMFRQKFPDLETQLEGINKIYNALEAENQRIDVIKKSAETAYDELNKKIGVLYGKVEGVDSNTIQGAKDELLKIQAILKKASELENQIELLSKSKDKALDTIKKSVEEQLKGLEKELTKAESAIQGQLKLDQSQIRQSLKAIKEEAKSMDEMSKQVNSFRREKEAAKKTLNDAKRAFNDEYSRIVGRMDTTGNALRTKINSMLEELNEIKANFGEMDKVYSGIQKSKQEIDATQKKITDLKSRADTLSDEIRALQTLKGSTEARFRATQGVADKVRDLGTETTKIENDTNKITKGMEDE